MSTNDYPVLCGGTFFTLLLEARGQRTSKRKNADGETDGLSQVELLVELVKIIKPTFKPPVKASTLGKNVGKYRQCTDNGGTYFSSVFESTDTDLFDERMNNNYNKVFLSTSIFVNRFIGEDKAEWLIKALLKVIENDKRITNNVKFNINGKIKTKPDLLAETEICLPAYLLGIWHYIVINVKDNTVGETTFSKWHIKNGETNSTWVLKRGKVGEINKKITILPFANEDTDTVNDESCNSAEEQINEQNEPFAHEKNADSSSAPKNGIVNNQMMFTQSGNNNIQVGNIASLTINNN
ncbi:hypothetical protein [Clostridium estertheticum]|uniref:Uncharacterized protein n=1 Tax=Clostridium estertheticum TaxID=238834 RepID=A0A7Y3SVX4_9CLOT|nr:hypothetical protein [Clostridium estertheticum]NNU76340.1 hypothetical protein [Clostridium estertheticum]WBL45835.1 hypothetical protein LOR37_14205 [Clostridium estertheticum]